MFHFFLWHDKKISNVVQTSVTLLGSLLKEEHLQED